MGDFWGSVIPGLMGSVIGSIATWLVTRDSIAKQFSKQLELINLQETKNNTTALKSVKNELDYNIVHLGSIEKMFSKLSVEFINYRELGLTSGLKSTSWERHSDTVGNVLNEKQLNEIITFYLNMSVEINNQVFNTERIEKLISTGLGVSKMLEHEISSRSDRK
ncbi:MULTISPECIES: hypothetical protein [Paenibacillus]|uniref:hypothetical protein n=1 Tax=Paenibacillus TaxID=44249 RepID=UPI001ABBBC81|nr:hypothetical protein [Paenibacillus polymyxa]MBO3283106.1 hypothetical protein [Paenibacillus polymyxa]